MKAGTVLPAVPPGTRILVIDDSEDLLASMSAMLDDAGYEAVTAKDAETGIAAHRARAADVVITDIFMPDKDGLETIVALRAQWPQLKIVAMSGGGGVAKQDYLAIAKHAGADATLRKPFKVEHVLRLLDGLLRRLPPP